MLAVELRPEETRGPLQDLVGSFELTILLLECSHTRRVARADPPHVTFVDVSLANPGPQRLGAVPKLHCDALHRAVLKKTRGRDPGRRTYPVLQLVQPYPKDASQ